MCVCVILVLDHDATWYNMVFHAYPNSEGPRDHIRSKQATVQKQIFFVHRVSDPLRIPKPIVSVDGVGVQPFLIIIAGPSSH